MAKKNTSDAAATAASQTGRNDAEIEAYLARVNQLRQDGYVPMPLQQTLGGAYNPSDPSWSGIINAHFSASCDPCNPCTNVGGLINSGGREETVTDADGIQHSYIAWGSDNQTPNHVVQWSDLLPYTATSQKHISELAAGLTVRPMFRFFSNAGGAVNVETMPYEAGGEWLRMKMRETLTAMASIGSETTTASGEKLSTTQQMQLDMLNEDLERYDKSYDVWKTTNEEVQKFIDRSNMPLLYLKWMQELCMLGLSMPELELSQDGDVRSSVQWQPRVVALSHRPIMACRLGKRAADGNIKEVKVSNYWLSDRQPEDYQLRIASLPLLDEQHPSHDIEARLRDWRLQNPRAPYTARPTRWMMPCVYPSVGQNYYPFMAWWSIFEGDIYPYLSTIISDRAIRKRNSNSVGRIVYIHTEYLDKINREQDAKKRIKEADRLRDEIFRQTTKFLNDKSKNGSTMLSFTFPNQRGEQTKAIEIVDVPFASKNAAEADKTELQEVASIVFFALGVHPELVGAIPGSAASKGGTYMREMLLIDEVTSASVLQQMMNRTMEVVQSVNKWDKEHLVWETPQKTLTTLDRSSTGVSTESMN